MCITKAQFSKKLNDIDITDIIGDEINVQKLENLSEDVLELLPSKIYRFRGCNKYSIQALQNDEIWGTRADKFNDPMECIPAYNMDTIRKHMEDELDEDKFNDYLNMIKDGNYSESIRKLYKDEILDTFTANVPVEISEEYHKGFCDKMKVFRENIFRFIEEELESDIDGFFASVFNFKYQMYIACFSESVTSPLMWGHYGAGQSGFAIEYEMNKSVKKCNKACGKYCDFFHLTHQFAPVLYEETRYDASSFFIQHLEGKIAEKFNVPMEKTLNRDRARPIKTILRKSKEWEYEKEWRMFEYNVDNQGEFSRFTNDIKPTAVYIGTKISEWYKVRIINICKKKNIPCYQMINTYTLNVYQLQTSHDLCKDS